MLIHSEISGQVVESAIEVHRQLGPGLLESAYEKCLCIELAERGVQFERQVKIPLEYKGRIIDCGFVADLIVEKKIVLELKSVDKVIPIHEAQLLTYLKITKLRVGFLINFNEKLCHAGIHRRVL